MLDLVPWFWFINILNDDENTSTILWKFDNLNDFDFNLRNFMFIF